MCGLVAMLSESGPVDREALLRAREALRHRGPDGEGLWIAPDRSVGLAHTRLGILDLEGGAQPFASADGRIHLIVNGELYDFERTREDLERHGHRFRTRCDSEVALHLYEEHGLAMLEHLRGEFALVLWDERRRLLFAARDRFGVKPLCYAQRAGTLFVASEAKALFAAGVRAAWDHASFFQAASLHYTLPGRTLFERVFQLEPGHYLLPTEVASRRIATGISTTRERTSPRRRSVSGSKPASSSGASTRRCACASGPTCPSPVSSAAASTRAPSSPSRCGTHRSRSPASR